MRRAYIPRALRERIWAQAKGQCGYCRTQEVVSGVALQVEHITPQARGGSTVEDNLWLACGQCNLHKRPRILGLDPQTGDRVQLFDPRRQAWTEHFAWTAGTTLIEGKTPIGRATVAMLQLNRTLLVEARRVWIAAGSHPPPD
jgi:hypothetical protein